jgi:hypothetical protein
MVLLCLAVAWLGSSRLLRRPKSEFFADPPLY